MTVVVRSPSGAVLFQEEVHTSRPAGGSPGPDEALPDGEVVLSVAIGATAQCSTWDNATGQYANETLTIPYGERGRPPDSAQCPRGACMLLGGDVEAQQGGLAWTCARCHLQARPTAACPLADPCPPPAVGTGTYNPAATSVQPLVDLACQKGVAAVPDINAALAAGGEAARSWAAAFLMSAYQCLDGSDKLPTFQPLFNALTEAPEWKDPKTALK